MDTTCQPPLGPSEGQGGPDSGRGSVLGRGEVRPGQPPRGRGHGRGVRGSGGRGGAERPTGAQMRHKFGNGVNGGDKTNKVWQRERE